MVKRKPKKVVPDQTAEDLILTLQENIRSFSHLRPRRLNRMVRRAVEEYRMPMVNSEARKR